VEREREKGKEGRTDR